MGRGCFFSGFWHSPICFLFKTQLQPFLKGIWEVAGIWNPQIAGLRCPQSPTGQHHTSGFILIYFDPVDSSWIRLGCARITHKDGIRVETPGFFYENCYTVTFNIVVSVQLFVTTTLSRNPSFGSRAAGFAWLKSD